MSERLIALLLCLVSGIAMMFFVTRILTRAGNLLADTANSGAKNKKNDDAMKMSFNMTTWTAQIVAKHPFVAVIALALLPSLGFFGIYTFSPPDYAKWTMTGQLADFPSTPLANAKASVRINANSIRLEPDGRFTYEFFVRRDEKLPNGGTIRFKRDGFCSVVVYASKDTDGNVEVKGTQMTATKTYAWKAEGTCPYENQ